MNTGYEAARSIFKNSNDKKERPSAFLIANDLLALGFMNYCGEHGIRIPDDISIVRFDDIAYSSLHQIQLTTVSQHVDTMSKEAADLMLQLLTDPPKEPKRVIIEPTLMIRNTTKAYQEP